MSTFYDALRIKYGACPSGCLDCQRVCAEKDDRKVARIRAVRTSMRSGVITCLQCAVPACMDTCPTGAITKSAIDGVVRISEQKCIGCGLCTVVCPYGGIYYDGNRKKAVKCDLCDGKPMCVETCKYGVLSLINNRPTLESLQGDSLLSPSSNLCPGCAAELWVRLTLRLLGKDTVIVSCPGCAGSFLAGLGTQATAKVATSLTLMPSVAAFMTGIKRYYTKLGQDVKVVSFVGDGATADVGFQSLSGAAEREENLIFICYDNEAYMNTGIQRSSTTSFGAWTATSPVGNIRKGKDTASKYMPLIMAIHGIPYVATAAVSHLEDYTMKLFKAMAVKDGMSYIHLLSPCPPGWRMRTDSAIEVSNMAVETNYFPLWETERGKYRITYKVSHPKPIEEFTKLMGRFSHLDRIGVKRLQQQVDDRFNMIDALTRISAQRADS